MTLWFSTSLSHLATARSMPSPEQLPSTTAESEDPTPSTASNDALPAEVAWAPDGAFRPVDPIYVTVERIGSWIFTVVVAAITMAVLTVAMLAGWLAGWWATMAAVIGLAFVAFIGWLTIKLPRWQYARLRYAVRETGVEIHRGILWRSIINVPRSRIQHTDVTQGPLARRYGIATLQMYTAGTQYNEVDLEGLRYEIALRIRDFLVGSRGANGF